MDSKFLILIVVGILLIGGAAAIGFNLGSQSTTTSGISMESPNGNLFCVSVEDTGVLIVSSGSCIKA